MKLWILGVSASKWHVGKRLNGIYSVSLCNGRAMSAHTAAQNDCPGPLCNLCAKKLEADPAFGEGGK